MKKWLQGILPLTILLAAACDEDLVGIGLSDMTGANVGYDDSGASRRLKVASVAMKCSLDRTPILHG